MMLDFLNPKLFPKVTCRVACMDGYEADNLISNNYLVKSRGFMAFSSIKPPVDVNFTLICPVNISYVRVNTINGSQKSVGVELLAKNTKSELVTIGHATFDEGGVVFCNSRTYSLQKPPPNSNGMTLVFFKSNTFRLFMNAIQITVRITRTERASVPCLGGVEIFGFVSKSCSQETFKNVMRMANKTCNTTNLNNKESIEVPKSDFVIPDEFKDEITYEIMSLPMTLPSGHNVDQTTIEKCINNDNSYGRLGSDPFTGLAFTDKRKPILNVALKSRIDMFLVENSHRKEVANVQRTVGRKKQERNAYYEPTYTNMINNATKKIKLDNKESRDDLTTTIDRIMNSEKFIRFTQPVIEKVDSKLCNLCYSKTNLYELPCKHLYCRICLLKICKKGACDCGKKFSTSDPKKLYL